MFTLNGGVNEFPFFGLASGLSLPKLQGRQLMSHRV